jgi:peptidoglycan/xylan/chitin deacetylase (PgdA/CDA1 family)
MAWVKTPVIFPWLFFRLKWKFITSSKTVYFTFDDGPTPEITRFVLDQLDKYDAKATFFCLGRNVERNPEIYTEIVSRGHKTGNHTYSHLNGWKTELKTYLADVELAKSDHAFFDHLMAK